jgi:hypothetical protein
VRVTAHQRRIPGGSPSFTSLPDRDLGIAPGRAEVSVLGRPFWVREERIRAHEVLCWLALLLIRLAEEATGDNWRNLRHELDRVHLVELAGTASSVMQRTELDARQRQIFAALGVPEPPRFADVRPF